MNRKKNPCLLCDWNFDGICASHGMYDPDTYGMTIEDTIKRFPNGCVEFRPSFGNEFEANHNISLDVISNLKGYKDV